MSKTNSKQLDDEFFKNILVFVFKNHSLISLFQLSNIFSCLTFLFHLGWGIYGNSEYYIVKEF